MTQYLHIDGKLIAEFHDLAWADKLARALHKWQITINHLPYRDFLPERHIRLTDKHTGDEIFDNHPPMTERQKNVALTSIALEIAANPKTPILEEENQ